MRRVQIKWGDPAVRVTLEEWDNETRTFKTVPLDDGTWDVIQLASRMNGRSMPYEEVQRIIYDVYH